MPKLKGERHYVEKDSQSGPERKDIGGRERTFYGVVQREVWGEEAEMERRRNRV